MGLETTTESKCFQHWSSCWLKLWQEVKLEFQDLGQCLRDQDQEGVLEGGNCFISVCSRALFPLDSTWYQPRAEADCRSQSAVGLSQPGSCGTPKALSNLGNLAYSDQMSLPLFSHTFTLELILAEILSSCWSCKYVCYLERGQRVSPWLSMDLIRNPTGILSVSCLYSPSLEQTHYCRHYFCMWCQRESAWLFISCPYANQ